MELEQLRDYSRLSLNQITTDRWNLREAAEGYKENTEDPSVWPKFTVAPVDGDLPAPLAGLPQPAHFLAWTTTPWTLPSNFALAVHPEHAYVRARLARKGEAPEIVWVARALERMGDHSKNLAEQVIYIVKGTDVRHTSFENVERKASL